jgi:hypothetical protein
MRYVFLAAGVVLSLCAAPLLAQKSSESRYLVTWVGDIDPSDRPSILDAVRKAAPQRVDGPIPTYVSAGAERRARDLQAMLLQGATFYRQRLGLSPTFTLALLDPGAWKAVTGGAVPYGLPFVDDRVMVLPFRQEGAIVTGYMVHVSSLPEDVMKRVETSRRPFAAHVADMVDLVGYHELGHLYVSDLGIEPHTKWFSELLATYIGYAFMAERLPALARTWEIVSRSDARTTPDHRSLADFERLYLFLGADNYIWYQNRFSERVFTVFAVDRLNFLRKVKDAFPSQRHETLTPAQVLDRLEKIRPGFKAWAMSFDVPKP